MISAFGILKRTSLSRMRNLQLYTPVVKYISIAFLGSNRSYNISSAHSESTFSPLPSKKEYRHDQKAQSDIPHEPNNHDALHVLPRRLLLSHHHLINLQPPPPLVFSKLHPQLRLFRVRTSLYTLRRAKWVQILQIGDNCPGFGDMWHQEEGRDDETWRWFFGCFTRETEEEGSC